MSGSKKSLLIVLTLAASSVLAESTNFNNSRKEFTPREIKEFVHQMSASELINLTLKGIGTCKAEFNGRGASYFYRFYSSQNQKAEFVGRNTQPSSFTTYTPEAGKLATSINKKETPSLASDPTNISASAKAEMHAHVLKRIFDGACGEIIMASQQVNFNNLTGDKVVFYKHPTDGLICKTDQFINKVINPTTCKAEETISYLPQKVCKFLYQVARSKATLAMSSKQIKNKIIKKDTSTPDPASSSIAELTPSLLMDYKIDKALKDPTNAELFSLAHALKKPSADDYVPAETLDILTNESIRISDFVNLSETNKIALTNLVLTIEETRKNENFIPWSDSMINVSEKLKKNVEFFVQTNPYLAYATFSIPTVEGYEKSMIDQFSAITKALGRANITPASCVKSTPIDIVYTKPTQVWEPSKGVIEEVRSANFNLGLIAVTIRPEMANIPDRVKAALETQVLFRGGASANASANQVNVDRINSVNGGFAGSPETQNNFQSEVDSAVSNLRR